MKSKKKVVKKVVRKSKAKPAPKKKVLAVAEPEKLYKVQLEVSSKSLTTGLTEYTYTDHESRQGVADTVAQELMDNLKAMGIGGRIILLDGSPEGLVQVTWGSVERTAEAEKVEKAALEKQ